MNKKIIKIDEKIRDLVESYDYELNARKELIAFMLSNNMEIDTDSFRKYQKEMNEFFVKFVTIKNEISNRYIIPITDGKEVNWKLDYASCEITIEFK